MIRRAVLVVAGLAAPAGAVELSGTYIQYAGTRDNGTMINESDRAMAYTETGAARSAATVFPRLPGGVLHDRDAGRLPGHQRLLDDPDRHHHPGVSGREMTWAGRYTNGAGVNVRVDQRFGYQASSRFAYLIVKLTNEGAALSNVYYLRNAIRTSGCATSAPSTRP